MAQQVLKREEAHHEEEKEEVIIAANSNVNTEYELGQVVILRKCDKLRVDCPYMAIIVALKRTQRGTSDPTWTSNMLAAEIPFNYYKNPEVRAFSKVYV